MFDFLTPVNRKGTWSTQWDYVKDRFGEADLLPFTISDMDFKTAPVILDALQQRIGHGVFGYSRWQHADFLGAVSHWYQQQFNVTINQDHVIYGPSVIYMVSQFIQMWSKVGEGVIVHTPAYDAFYKVLHRTERQCIPCPLKLVEGEWLCDMNYLESLMKTTSARILLLCSPQNPTGKVWSASELAQMADLCQRYGIYVISDEIHMDMTWQNHCHIPWLEAAKTPCAVLTSASKSFNIPALLGAYGFVTDTADRQYYTTQLKERDALSSAPVLSITAHIAGYQSGLPWLTELKKTLWENLLYVKHRLEDEFADFHYSLPEASYLAWLDLNQLGLDEQRLQTYLIHQQKVAIMPGSTYGSEGKGFLRLNVGCPKSKVEQGINRLIAAIHDYRE